MQYNGLDLFNATIKDFADGIVFISLVDDPAVERNFVCFKAEKEPLRFKIENEEKRIITGVVMLANSPILRINGDYRYYVTYTPETLQKMSEKMLFDGTFHNIDIQHNNEKITGVNLVEVYQKDSVKGIAPNFIDDVPDGSLLASFHVTDDALWDEIKNGDFLKGFSLEGFFTMERMSKANNNQINKDNKMSKGKIAKFVKSLMKFGQVETDKGILYFEPEEIAVDVEVFVGDEEKTVAEDGEYVWDEKTIVVKDGKVAEIIEKEEEVETPAEPEPEVEAEEETVVEEPVEVIDDKESRIAALEAQVAALEGMVADLQAQVAEIVSKPETTPIVEEFEKAKDVEVAGLPKSAQKAMKLFKNFKK